MLRRPRRFRAGRTPWAVLLFLVGAVALIVFVFFSYLQPALEAAQGADPKQRRGLAAFAWLLMSLVLFTLLVGLMMTFRVGRFFFPRSAPPTTKTKYVDAWAESGKRLSVPDDLDDDAPA